MQDHSLSGALGGFVASGLFGVTAAGIAVVMVFVLTDGAALSFAVTASLMMGLAVFWAVRRWLATRDLLETGPLGLLLFVSYFVVAGAGLLAHPEVMRIPVEVKWLQKALWYALIGMAAFWMGYSLVTSRGLSRTHLGVKLVGPRPNLAVLMGVSLTGWAVNFLLWRMGIFGYAPNWRSALDISLSGIGQALVLISGLPRVAMLAAGIEGYRTGGAAKWYRTLFWVLWGGEIAWALLSGMKGRLLGPLVTYVLVQWYVGRRLPVKAIVFGLASLLVLVPLNAAYRDLINLGAFSGARAQPMALLFEAANTVFTKLDSPMTLIQGLARWYTARNSILYSVALIAGSEASAVQLTPHHVYFILPLYPFIPRLFWPEKPVLDTGRRFAIYYLGEPENTRNSVAISLVGDALMAFGPGGVVVWLFLIGLLYGALYRWFRARPTPFRFLIYATVGPLPAIEQTVPELVAQALQRSMVVLIVGVVLYRLRLGRRSPVPRAAPNPYPM